MPSSPSPESESSSPWRPILDWGVISILAIASLLAAWSGYEASKWGGQQSAATSRAALDQAIANTEETKGYLVASADMANLSSWVSAYLAGDEELMAFFERRFTPAFKTAFDAWVAEKPRTNPDAAVSPLDMEAYVNPYLVRAGQLGQQAADNRSFAAIASERSDKHVLNTVIFALALFFAGFASRIRVTKAQVIVELLAALFVIVGIVQIIRIPTA